MTPEDLWNQYTSEEDRAFFQSLPFEGLSFERLSFERLSEELETQLQSKLTMILARIPMAEFLILGQHLSSNPIIEYIVQNFLGQIRCSTNVCCKYNYYKINAFTLGLEPIIQNISTEELQSYYDHVRISRCRYPQPISRERLGDSHGVMGLIGPAGPCCFNSCRMTQRRLEDEYK